MTTFWSGYPLYALILIPLLTLILMYLIREQSHALILRAAKLLHGQLRLLARSCLYAAQRIRLRNHEVTKALAESLMERQLERRFMRIETLVERDLANYQKLSTDINTRLVVMDGDYEESTLVPDVSPEWVAAVERLASLEGEDRNNAVMGKILADMHATVQEHQREAMREHRWTVSARHKVLSGLRPQWRKLSKLLEHIDHNIDVLRQRLRLIDKQMSQFEMLTAGSGQGIMASMLMRFIIALCFVLVGVGAAWVNMQLLQEPLAEVFAQRQIGGLPLAEMVALLHVGITLVAATMIFESLRVTHLLPLMGAMSKRGRHVLVAIGGVLLLLLAGIEALGLLGASAVTASSVANTAELSGMSQGILVILGVVMPLVLALVVIPLEYLLHTVRPILGGAVHMLMHFSSLVLRLLAGFALHMGRFTVNCYDLLIFLPLWIEASWKSRAAAAVLANAAATEALSDTVDSRNVTAIRFGISDNQRS